MLENVTNKFIEARAELMNNLTKDLLKRIGIYIDDTYNNFDTLMVADDLSRKGYRLKVKNEGLKTVIAIYQIGDLHDDLICGYSLEVESDEILVRIVAKEIEN